MSNQLRVIEKVKKTFKLTQKRQHKKAQKQSITASLSLQEKYRKISLKKRTLSKNLKISISGI